jgi:transcriptional regulator with XRE-family HTH domain
MLKLDMDAPIEPAYRPIDIFVGRRLNQMRVLCDVSLAELEKKSKIRVSTLQKYEHGAVHIKPNDLFLIAQALNTPLYSFYVKEGVAPVISRDSLAVEVEVEVTAPEDAEKAVPPSRAETQHLLHMYYGIKDFSVRKGVVSLVEQISRLTDSRQAAP